MFREAHGVKKIVIVCGMTDMRRGIDGLVALVRLNYGLDALEENTMFLFCGIRKDRIKGLIFEGDGFCLCYKRLSNGRFQWPKDSGEARNISLEQYRRLMDGFTIDSSIKRIG
ncbi:MAG: IS66 family insertion sequence element accessory protein TnpB [Lachnospiraceae bacterium]|nr:IS66 family insertion sequence element accessory protein TnpB [Lachnospiraceae bacterium]